jgi:peroxiredoxin
MIEIGKEAPDFELASHLGGTKFTLGQFKNKKNVMLVFYPLDWTPNPKGEMAKKYGVFLEDKGITDRATVIIDKQSVVRYAKSVTPAGERNPQELLAEAQKVNNGH